jgi:hypothetical protein
MDGRGKRVWLAPSGGRIRFAGTPLRIHSTPA